MPGSIISSMPPQDDDPQRRQRDLERQAREQASARSGQAMQIGAGGILITDGGSLTISGTGALHVGSGALDSAGSITAATDITAGGNVTAAGTVQGDDLVSTGAASVAGALSAGSVSSGDVVSSGQVQSNGAPVKSQPSHDYTVTTGYVACWINSDGSFGTSPSSASAKIDLAAFTSDDAKRFLDTVTPYWGRYKWDAPDSPLKVFVTAEDVAAAGFGPDVAPLVDGDEPRNIGTAEDPILIEPGQPWTVNYSQLVIPLLAAVKSQQAQIDALTARLAAAGIA